MALRGKSGIRTRRFSIRASNHFQKSMILLSSHVCRGSSSPSSHVWSEECQSFPVTSGATRGLRGWLVSGIGVRMDGWPAAAPRRIPTDWWGRRDAAIDCSSVSGQPGTDKTLPAICPDRVRASWARRRQCPSLTNSAVWKDEEQLGCDPFQVEQLHSGHS